MYRLYRMVRILHNENGEKDIMIGTHVIHNDFSRIQLFFSKIKKIKLNM